MDKTANILIVDDEVGFRELMQYILVKEGYGVDTAASSEEGLNLVHQNTYDIIYVDLKMPGMDGLALLKALKEIDENAIVLMITGHGSIETAVEAMKYGAEDYITKPFDRDEIIKITRKAWEKKQLVDEMLYLRQEIDRRYCFENIIGKSKVIQDLFEMIKRAAETKSTVLIQGESGTGKELIARAIHYNSPRKRKRLVTINTSALQDTLLESELFGHLKGAFTGAYTTKKGLFEVADGGTLFLDEIGDTSPNIQIKLLRVLEENEFIPVGGVTPVKVDVRLIAATNKDLYKAVKEGTFRNDLFYRLKVITINILPLRERKEDIPLLAAHFLKKYARESGKEIDTISPQALELLMGYGWPGNVRELENTIKAAVDLETGKMVTTKYLGLNSWRGYSERALHTEKNIVSFQEAKRLFEREFIADALRRCKGNIAQAARETGIIRPNLYEKIKRYGIRIEDYKP
ncbi:MAG: sigma-54 dependent transcriptional regulator [Thermodesulfobacteriota bacterium]